MSGRKRRRKVKKQINQPPKKQIKSTKNKIINNKTFTKKKFFTRRKGITFLILISIFCLVLFMNSYFNYTSGIAHNPDGETLGTRFYLSGPDPYYNMRLCEETLKTGHYPFVGDDVDYMLDYPIGAKGVARPPLFNMIAIASAQIGSNFMSQTDALGWSMLFLPALYGALLIFPIYGIGKELFNKKVGITSAFFISIIPIHIGTGHGSAFSLFDHDSFLLLLTTCVIYFLIKSFKEKNSKKAFLYAIFSGVFVGSMELSWVAAEFIFILILVYIFVQLIFDIVRKNMVLKNIYLPSMALLTGFILSAPYALLKNSLFNDFPFYAAIISIGVCVLYYIIKKMNIPWILSLPSMILMSGIGLTFFYLININVINIYGPLRKISKILYGTGIYGQKVSLTIGEAHTYNLSNTVMSIGPILYWIGMAGFIFFIIKTYKEKWKPQNILFLVLFIVDMWLLSIAGRFLNDLIPTLIIFAGYFSIYILDKIDYKKMIKNMNNLNGIQKFKGIKFFHILGIIFIIFLITPNILCTLNAAVPPKMKSEFFGDDYEGMWGLSLGQQYAWSDACYWLSQQDTEIKNPEDRPGFISWWDYGFYEASMGEHPTVAENFQDGIAPAANFHTSKSEKEAVSVLITRIIDGVKYRNDEKLNEIKTIFEKYTDEKNASKLINIIKDPKKYAPSYDTIIKPEWGNTDLRVTMRNAMYHDCSKILINLSDEKITNIYHELMKFTGYSIRYYGVESYDTQIFGVFSFLADKGVHGYSTYEDDYFATIYTDSKTGKQYTYDQLSNISQIEIEKMDLNPSTVKKDAYYETMFYNTFYGIDKDTSNRLPTYGLKHFVPVYLTNRIIIAKYYEGAKINGTVFVDDIPYYGAQIYVLDELIQMPHDYDTIDKNGEFSVIAPAGNITLGVFIGENEIGKIKFNSIDNPPISEDEAMRNIDLNRTINFNLDKSNVTGNINTNLTNLSKIKIELLNVPLTYTENITDNNFNFNDILPGKYKINIIDVDGNVTYTDNKFFKSNENNIEINIGENI